MSFYGPFADLYEDNFKNQDGSFGCSKKEIVKAIKELESIKDHEWDGGSSDRELVRDVMLFRRGWDLLDLEFGQYIEKNLLGKPMSRERIKQYWTKNLEGMDIKITPQMKKKWEKRLDQLEIFDN